MADNDVKNLNNAESGTPANEADQNKGATEEKKPGTVRKVLKWAGAGLAFVATALISFAAGKNSGSDGDDTEAAEETTTE